MIDTLPFIDNILMLHFKSINVTFHIIFDIGAMIAFLIDFGVIELESLIGAKIKIKIKYYYFGKSIGIKN